MAFDTWETSTQDGRPVALYTLRWGRTFWRYTSADRAIKRTELVGNTMQVVIYAPIAIKDDGVRQGAGAQNNMTVVIPANLPIVDLYRGTPPSDDVWLTVRRQHFGENDAPIYWKGTVDNVRRTGPASASIIGKPLTASLKRTGLRLCWTRECPHFLYDAGCKVNKDDFRISAVVASVAGDRFTVNAHGKPDDYFRGGFVAWEANADGTIERRMIELQTDVEFRLFGLTDRMIVGMAVDLYPGCTRVPTVCQEKFNNLANYGGFDKMPGKTPFGTAIF